MQLRLWIAVPVLLASSSVGRAELRFTQPAVNLGELRGGPAYQHRFDFVNDSASPLEILDIRLGCGCLQPALDKRLYLPGEKGAVIMHVRTLGQQAGGRVWQAHVQYRQANAIHETTLLIGARLRNEVTVEPSILAMSIETTLRQEVTIVDHRATPMKITAVVASSPAIRVTMESAGAGVTKAIVEVSAAALTASRQEELLSIYTDDPNYRQLQVPITLVKVQRADVASTPERVELTAGGSQLVRLRSRRGQAVRIDKAESNHPGIKCTWASGPGNDATVKISVAKSAPTGPVSAEPSIRVFLAEPAGATLAIPIHWRKE